MKRLAIIGAGLAGLAVAWHWLRAKKGDVVLFDPKGIGGGASGVSTGLLHPFPGKLALRSWRASEGIEATRELIEASERALGRSVAEHSGVLRLAADEQLQAEFRERTQGDREAIWWEAGQVLGMVPQATAWPGLWIPSGITVYTRIYLEGLWVACKEMGAQLQKIRIGNLSDLNAYDRIVLAAGSETLQFPECRSLSLEPIKGQTLLCRWSTKLPCSLVSNGHITPTEDPNLCQIGSTYERDFHDALPDPAVASTLLERAAAFYPPARHFSVVETRAAVRMAIKHNQYRPLVQQVGPKTWVFTGLGSRGLLYHALLAKELVFH